MRVKRYGKTVKIWASVNDTYRWAHRSGESWPCSRLSGNRVFIELDNGDLVDLALNGEIPEDLDATELNAFIEDTLRDYPSKQENP